MERNIPLPALTQDEVRVGAWAEVREPLELQLAPLDRQALAALVPQHGERALAATLASDASAQTPNDPAIEACRATGLLALKERSPSLRDVVFDMETLAVSKANTRIEGIPVRLVIMGEAYLERKETGKAQRFVCLVGDKGKVLLTFFTAQ